MKVTYQPLVTIIIIITTTIHIYIEQLQGFASNIIYLHVPLSWITLLGYTILTISSIGYLIYKNPIIKIIYQAVLNYTILTCSFSIITGSLWAKPTWNTYLTWDIRIISMVILLITLIILKAISKPYILTIIASINIIIIKYLVNWYTTIHQKSSISNQDSKIHVSILYPLLMILIFLIGYLIIITITKIKTNLYKKWLSY